MRAQVVRMDVVAVVLVAATAADETKSADELIDHGTPCARSRPEDGLSVDRIAPGNHPEFPVAGPRTYGRLSSSTAEMDTPIRPRSSRT